MSAEYVRNQKLDKFYTVPFVVETCIDRLLKHFHKNEWDTWGTVIEPSAGNGSFIKQIKHRNLISLDISPEHPDIVQQDFLLYEPTELSPVLVIGNPPFGKGSSLAIKFFNHASTFAQTIAFIVPRTFRRTSVQNRLDLTFRLVFDEDVAVKPCSFFPPMGVKCCFQIWEKSPKHEPNREVKQLPTTHADWSFLPMGPLDPRTKQPTPPPYGTVDFAVRAYGGKCGEIVSDPDAIDKLRPKSWHFVRCNSNKIDIIQRFNDLDFSICTDTARQNSLGRADLVLLYTNKEYV